MSCYQYTNIRAWKAFWCSIALVTLVLFLLSNAYCAELPSAPSSTPGSRAIFWTAAGVAVGGTLFDEHTTSQGLYHSTGGCSELNGGDPYPSQAKLYAKNLAITGAAVGAGYLITRLPVWRGHPKLAALVGSTIPAIVAYKHIHGGVRWYTFKNGACLR